MHVNMHGNYMHGICIATITNFAVSCGARARARARARAKFDNYTLYRCQVLTSKNSTNGTEKITAKQLPHLLSASHSTPPPT